MTKSDAVKVKMDLFSMCSIQICSNQVGRWIQLVRTNEKAAYVFARYLNHVAPEESIGTFTISILESIKVNDSFLEKLFSTCACIHRKHSLALTRC